MTLKELQAELDARDDGVLLKGTHTAGGTEFCALEFESQVRGRTWSDTPVTLPDVRPLNDGPWSSNQARTNAILPVMVALWEWSTWDRARQQTWIERVVVDTTRQIIGSLPGLPRAIQQQCEAVQDLESAVNTISAAVAAAFATHSVAAYASAASARATHSAAAYASAAAAYAALATHSSASYASYASYAAFAAFAAKTAADAVLRRACQIWIDATEQSAERTYAEHQ